MGGLRRQRSDRFPGILGICTGRNYGRTGNHLFGSGAGIPAKKYDMLLTEDSTLFDEIALELMPVFIRDNEYEIHPVWAFRGQIQVEDWGSSDIELFFDGFSGKEITS